jgi:putative membrane protein
LHQVLLDDLKGASDENFDGRYIAQQKLAHTEATTLFKSFESRGDFSAGLKNLCRLGLPVLEGHQRALERLEET